MSTGERVPVRSLAGAPVSAERFRAAMRGVPAPVTVIAALTATGAHATTVSAFSSLSLDPPLVLAALDGSSELLATLVLHDRARFAVHVLGAGQEELARQCAEKRPDKLASVRWTEREGVPCIEGGVAWLACEVEDLVPAGDHVIVTGLVVATEVHAAPALAYRARRFHLVD